MHILEGLSSIDIFKVHIHGVCRIFPLYLIIILVIFKLDQILASLVRFHSQILSLIQLLKFLQFIRGSLIYYGTLRVFLVHF